MKLIVGLGNPGSQYERTRHNVGFMAIDRLAQKNHAANFRSAHEAFLADINVSGQKIILLKPQTFMNLSGRAVASAMAYYKIALEDLLVIVDDIALSCGVIRLRPGGSAGGHNGLKDIEGALFNVTSAAGKLAIDYSRLRIGIDAPGRVPQKNYVLEPFSGAQAPKIDEAITRAGEAAVVWANEGIQAAMNRFNPKESKDKE